ncbi:hypothetical protein PVMG_05728 [Plasmodium vivax Mauritania I]|uniref:VIR protein n=1 Tax=Plasmodium vivax Mauritania I TaxID=1035515 RepID=A0A0J9T6H6_PLAVI|nr:hypothetical protein PVMG_05728 [Plasmodium vivax Mauritania I]
MGNTAYKILRNYVNISEEELPSQYFYHYFKKYSNNINQYYEVCKSRDYPHNTDSNILNICGKLVSHLKTNYENLNDCDLKHHHCNFLSLWIYEQLVEKFKGDSSTIIRIYGGFKLILSDIFNGCSEPEASECLRDVHLLTSNNWKKRKDLYDYCVDYDEIIKKSPSSYDECKTYEKYLKDISLLYEKFNELYIPEYNIKNPDFYGKCNSYNPVSMLRELNCEKKFPDYPKAKADEPGPGLLAPTPFTAQKSDSTNTYGNVLLGVVATSMTSGMIFKVNKILIKTYQHYKLFNNLFAIQINSK